MIEEYDPKIHSQKAMCLRMALDAGLSEEDAEKACSTIPDNRGMLEGDVEPEPQNQNFDVSDIFPSMQFVSDKKPDSITSPCSHQAESQNLPEEKKDCFGTTKSRTCKGTCNPECFHAYLAESFKPQAEKDREQKRKIIELLKQSRILRENSSVETDEQKKFRVIKEFDDYREEDPEDWPELEKKTRGDEYGKPVQPTTVPKLHGKTRERVLDELKEEESR